MRRRSCRDPEAAFTYASEELMTGHPGSPSTIHGKDASQAVTRLFDLVKGSEAGRNDSDQVVISQLGMVVDVVVPFRERKAHSKSAKRGSPPMRSAAARRSRS